MEKLELPQPAAALWMATRDILTNLGPELRPLRTYLGGGTTLAARVKHRRSVDIDVVVMPRADLSRMTRDNDENLARRLGGRQMTANAGQIKVAGPHGIIDLNTAPVAPKRGASTAIIAGRHQGVLSTTQIVRGKLERAARPAPVRDVYDLIRLSLEPATAGSVAAAYGMLPTHRQDRIENILSHRNEAYRLQASTQLELTEEPRADMRRLGTAAATALNGQRLTRVVVEVNPERTTVRRETAAGGLYTDSGPTAAVQDLIEATGTRGRLMEAAGDEETLRRILRLGAYRGGDGLTVDTTDWGGMDRLRIEAARSGAPTGGRNKAPGPRRGGNMARGGPPAGTARGYRSRGYGS